MPSPGDHSDSTARSRKKHSSIIVPAAEVHLRGAPMIDVTSLDALVQVAKKYETVIVEVVDADPGEFLLWDDGMVFRFVDVPEHDAVAAVSPSRPLVRLRRNEVPAASAEAPAATDT